MSKKINWSQFFISVLGTAIGVGLTFGLNGMMERHKQDKAQRLTAIMVIHDIDCTIDIIKSWKKQEESADDLLHYAIEHRDDVDMMPYDTLVKVITCLVDEGREFHFDTSKEKIFNSDLDTWQNLGNMKFLDNVQSFFYDRQSLQDVVNHSETWVAPIPRREYMQMYMETSRKSVEEFSDMARVFLKEKLPDNKVKFYIDVAYFRIKTLNGIIDEWTKLNEENKFLMGITDKELEDYINHIDVNGEAVTDKSLKGTWIHSKEKLSQKFSFSADHTYSSEMKGSESGHWLNFSGEFSTTLSFTGTWEIKGDSLILNADSPSFVFELDDSRLVPAEGKQDSLDSWIKEYREEMKERYGSMTEKDLRTSFKARLDSSKDKMEMTDSDGSVRYLRRK